MSGQTEAITFTYDREYEPAILAAAGRMFGRPGEGRIVGEPRSASRGVLVVFVTLDYGPGLAELIEQRRRGLAATAAVPWSAVQLDSYR